MPQVIFLRFPFHLIKPGKTEITIDRLIAVSPCRQGWGHDTAWVRSQTRNLNLLIHKLTGRMTGWTGLVNQIFIFGVLPDNGRKETGNFSGSWDSIDRLPTAGLKDADCAKTQYFARKNVAPWYFTRITLYNYTMNKASCQNVDKEIKQS